jgi:hypothetical protein
MPRTRSARASLRAWRGQGGNLTGVLHLEASIVGKWLAMLKEIAPRLTRAALMGNRKTSTLDYFLQSAQAVCA